MAENTEIRDHQKKTGSDKRTEDRDEAEIPDRIGVEAKETRKIAQGYERGDERNRSAGSIRRDGEVAELEEERMQANLTENAKTDPLGRVVMRR